MNRFALIVAGGKGLRMGSDLPKQFMLLHGLPVLMHTVNKFASLGNVNIILVLPQNQFEYWQELCVTHDFKIPHELTAGGLTRFESVSNGLKLLPKEPSLVAIHDGVRPLVSAEMIENSFQKAAEKGNAVCVVPLKDSLRKQELLTNHSVNRANYYLVQTPQIFLSTEIIHAYISATHDNFTDDAGVLEESGKTIVMVEGDYKNIKITTPEDLAIAEVLMK